MSNTCRLCEEPVRTRGLCRSHYTKQLRIERLAKKPDVTRECIECGKAFVTKNPDAKVCSIICRQRYAAKKSDQNQRDFGQLPCKVCGTVFTKKTKAQLFCSLSCRAKDQRAKHIDRYRAADRVKVRRQQIGLGIRDETMKTPTKTAKWLWDGIGYWSKKYWREFDRCLECNTNVYVHDTNGVCAYCVGKLRHRDPEKLKELKAKAYQKAKANGRKSSRSVSEEWIDLAKKKVIPETPVIENLLENLEKLPTGKKK